MGSAQWGLGGCCDGFATDLGLGGHVCSRDPRLLRVAKAAADDKVLPTDLLRSGEDEQFSAGAEQCTWWQMRIVCRRFLGAHRV